MNILFPHQTIPLGSIIKLAMLIFLSTIINIYKVFVFNFQIEEKSDENDDESEAETEAKCEENVDDPEFVEDKCAPSSENIDFNEFNMESENIQTISFDTNTIENNDEANKSNMKILCQQIISEANGSSESVLLLPVKPLEDIEKDSSNLVGETKHISEFLCNEVYLNSQLIDDLSIFTDNSNFNRENSLVSSLSTAESEKLAQLKPLNSDENSKTSILKGSTAEKVSTVTSSSNKLKQIKKKVSFDEAELVNIVKKRKIFVNKDKQETSTISSRTRSNRKISSDQQHSSKKTNYKCDIKLMDEDSYQRKLFEIRERKIEDVRLKQRLDLMLNKRTDVTSKKRANNHRVPRKENEAYVNNEIFILPSGKDSNEDEDEDIILFSENNLKISQTCKWKSLYITFM